MGVKVGDKVVLRAYPNGANEVAWCEKDIEYIGKTVTVTAVCDDGDIEFDGPRSEYHWPPGYFDLAVPATFNVTDPCIQHALKKLLVAGGRGAGKDINRDIQEAIDTLVRWQEMQTEGVGK